MRTVTIDETGTEYTMIMTDHILTAYYSSGKPVTDENIRRAVIEAWFR